ncbi:TPA: PxKF domain-containing protein [Vibrio parahaemolyticus]|nr:PxKF domain-containing protein [Vibrio parahaemolyticus]
MNAQHDLNSLTWMSFRVVILAWWFSSVVAFANSTGPIDRVSESAVGEVGDSYSYAIRGMVNHISADNRYVVFSSVASNLVGEFNGYAQIYLYDREDGSKSIISRLGVGGDLGNGGSAQPSISADGRYVVFQSNATNLVDEDTNGYLTDIFVYDRQEESFEIVSRASSVGNDLGQQGSGFSSNPSISGDGRYVSFASFSNDLVDEDTNGSNSDVFVYDRQNETIEIVSRASSVGSVIGEQGSSGSFLPVISSDGRYVAFMSPSPNLVENDTNGSTDVFVYDRQDEILDRIDSEFGAQPNHNSYDPSISADGRYVAFRSFATNLSSTDANGYRQDVFVYDRQTGVVELVSRASSVGGASGEQSNRSSFEPSISADGRYVAFRSEATNLVDPDLNGAAADVYVYDRIMETLELVSADESGVQGDSTSLEPSLSPDGSVVMFASYAANFVSGPQSYYTQVFVKQLSSGVAPVANAGSDQVVEATGNPNTDVSLDGSGSSDADGDALTFSWVWSLDFAVGEMPTVSLPLGEHLITLTVSDGSLEDSDDVTVIVQDTTPPVLTVPDDVEVFAAGALTSVDIGEAEATDLFGATVSHDAPSQFPPGETIVNWTADDPNGNSSSAVQVVTVGYEFSGFDNPIEGMPVLNLAKAGQTIPVKWSVPSSAGGLISDTSIVSSIQFSTESCTEDTIASTDISDAQSSGSTGLRYDATTNQFIFNWKTSKGMKGSCRMLHLNLNDGSVYQAKFQFR